MPCAKHQKLTAAEVLGYMPRILYLVGLIVDDELIKNTIKGMSGTLEQLALMIDRDVAVAEAELNWAIKRNVKDEKYIEQLFGKLLDLAGMNDKGLKLFKRLCRYYYPTNPHLTAEYVFIYRDLYDSADEDESGNAN